MIFIPFVLFVAIGTVTWRIGVTSVMTFLDDVMHTYVKHRQSLKYRCRKSALQSQTVTVDVEVPPASAADILSYPSLPSVASVRISVGPLEDATNTIDYPRKIAEIQSEQYQSSLQSNNVKPIMHLIIPFLMNHEVQP